MHFIKIFGFLGVYSLFFSHLQAQSTVPVQWQFQVKEVSPKEIELIVTADMASNWVIYSQNTAEGGPKPTQFTINGTFVKFEERTEPLKEFDELFEVEVVKFKNKAVFALRLPVTADRKVKGTVDYMTCDGSRCLPPKEVPFEKVY